MSEQGPGWLGGYDWAMWLVALAALLQILAIFLRCCRSSNRNVNHVLQESAKYISAVDAEKVRKYNKPQLELASKRMDLMFKRMKTADLIEKNKNRHLDDMDGLFGKAKNLVDKL